MTEAPSEGTDLVDASPAYSLAAEVENLTLTGAAAINATGNALDNTLSGNAAANVLNGGAGRSRHPDRRPGRRHLRRRQRRRCPDRDRRRRPDSVQSSVTYILADNVDNLTLTGTTAINGTGNALNNVLTGNSGANVLTGGLVRRHLRRRDRRHRGREAAGEGVDGFFSIHPSPMYLPTT